MNLNLYIDNLTFIGFWNKVSILTSVELVKVVKNFI